MAGRVFVVGTPIGNLGDITLRAVETLKRVGRVYAEDTRRTQVLLRHLGIDGKRLISLNAHASEKSLDTVLSILAEGDDIALVSDAGMPSVSDPGTDLVRRAREAGFQVEVIPGPSAVTTAVATSGLVESGFTFLGFLPRKGTKRRALLLQIQKSELPTIFFESPHRIAETLVEFAELMPLRKVAICRELTKKFEEVRVTTLEDSARPDFKEEWLGELTIVVSGSGEEAPEESSFDAEEKMRTLLARGTSVKETVQTLHRDALAAGIRLKKQDLYTRAQELADEEAGCATVPPPSADADH